MNKIEASYVGGRVLLSVGEDTLVWRTADEFAIFMGAIIDGHPQLVQPCPQGRQVFLGMIKPGQPLFAFVPHEGAEEFRMDMGILVNRVVWQERAYEAALAALY